MNTRYAAITNSSEDCVQTLRGLSRDGKQEVQHKIELIVNKDLPYKEVRRRTERIVRDVHKHLTELGVPKRAVKRYVELQSIRSAISARLFIKGKTEEQAIVWLNNIPKERNVIDSYQILVQSAPMLEADTQDIDLAFKAMSRADAFLVKDFANYIIDMPK